MKEHAKEAIPDWDDWPTEEPGYAPPSAAPCVGAMAPSKSALYSPAATAPAWGEKRSVAAPMAVPALPFPCHARPSHFPTLFARSGLFSAQRQPRAGATPTQTLVIKGQMHHSVEFEGPRLSMNDKAVYEAVVRLAKARKQDLRAPMRSSLTAIANEMGWSAHGGRDLDWVGRGLERLAQSTVCLQLSNKSRETGKLLESVTKDALGIEIAFDSTFALAAFGDGQQFRIDSARRARLGSPLAQWLHDFLSTHKEGHPLTLSYLQELCGSEASRKRFCRALREAAASLCVIAPELVTSFVIDDFRRSSEDWTIKFQRGAEACDFFSASDFAKRQQGRAEKSARQRGLSL
jgi:hypothetical protein